MSQAYAYDPSALRDVFERRFTFIAAFRRNVHRYAERLAMLDPVTGRSWTYRQLGADRLAAGLAGRGVQAGDVITFQLFNSAEFALLYLAARRLRVIAAPVNFRFSAGETAHMLDDSLPRVHVYDATLAPVAGQALGLSMHRPDLLVSAPLAGPDGAGDGSVPFWDLVAEEAAGFALPDAGSTWDETTRLPATVTSTTRSRRPPGSATAGCSPATWPPGTRWDYVTIVGRKDDMIISGGENVHPMLAKAEVAASSGLDDFDRP